MAVESGIRAILRDRAAASETEVCGALLGQDGCIQETVPLRNQSPDQFCRYCIPAEIVMELENTAASKGQVLLGFYHSHPRGDAVPSATDLELAVPGYIYVIASRTGDVRGWRLRDDRSAFDEVNLTDCDDG